MRIADLTSGAAKMASAYKKLRVQWEDTKDRWHDENRANFEKNYLDPLEPQITAALDAINALAEVMNRAQRECE
jgi:Rho-binding protein